MYKIKFMIHKFCLKIYSKIQNDIEDTRSVKKLNKKDMIIFYSKKLLVNLPKVLKPSFNIKYVEIALTTMCTLKCKDCANLMQYYKCPYHVDLDTNINSLKRILDNVDSINQLGVLGGEPLLYPDLYKIIKFINDEEKIKKVKIITNGTLLINNQKILELLKNKKFEIYISNYGEISKKKEQLINQLKSENIKYYMPEEDWIWHDVGDLHFRNKNSKELEKQYYKCNMECNNILNGKLHHCPRSTCGTDLKEIPLKDEDYIDLLDYSLDKKAFRKKLYKFFYGYTKYIEACNYCDSRTKNMKVVKPGIQI